MEVPVTKVCVCILSAYKHSVLFYLYQTRILFKSDILNYFFFVGKQMDCRYSQIRSATNLNFRSEFYEVFPDFFSRRSRNVPRK